MALIVENTRDLAGICGLDLQMIFMNAAGQALIGFANPGDVQQTKLTDYFAPEDRKYVTSEILPRVIRGEPWEGELRLNQLKKERISVARWHLFRIDDPSGLSQRMSPASPRTSRSENSLKTLYARRKRPY